MMSICERCDREITGKVMIFSDELIEGTYCLDCYNEILSQIMGIPFKKVPFKPMQITDAYGEKHTFYFESRLVATGVVIEAYERLNENDEGYSFSILGNFEQDLRDIHAQLLQKIQKVLKRKHLEKNSNNKNFSLCDIVRGRISYSKEFESPLIIIDGKSFLLEEFGDMLMTFEGFDFRLEIFDPLDEVQ